MLDETEWTSDHSSIGQLRLSLWRLDSLYRIQYSLHTSLEGILEAKRELMDQMEEVTFVAADTAGMANH